MNYKHTQIGYLVIYTLLAIVLYFGFIFNQIKFYPEVIFIILVIIFILFSFLSLTVIINEKYLQIKLGYGLFKKNFLLNEIKSIKKVKNHWYYGWGIRVWFWPYMWIYNVSGFDAIEIVMKNGKIYRIGTDDVEKLEKSLLKKIK